MTVGISRLRNSRVLSIISILLVSAFLLQVANRSLFLHTHILADGTIVMHAHPHEKTDESNPVPNHTHSKLGYFILTHIEILFLIFVVPFILLVKRIKTSLVVTRYLVSDRLTICLLKSRGPPIAYALT